MPTASEYITQIYAGYFNRAPDPAGLNYWAGRFNAGMSLLDIAQSFSVQPETVALYSFLASGGPPAAFLNSIYNNLLARAPDAAGAAYWTAQLASSMPVGRVIIDIISGAQGNDILLINNKVAVGQHFVNEIQRLNVPFNMDVAKGAYASVTSNTASITTAVSALAALIPGLGPLPILDVRGSTFTLTTGVDNFVGFAGNDIFNAIVNSDAGSGQTLTGGDTIDGGGGAGDVLNILFNPASTVSMPAAFVTSVEIFNLRNISGKALTFDAATVVGETSVNMDKSTNLVTITNLAAGASAGNHAGGGGGNNGSIAIGYAQTGGTGIVNISSSIGDALFGPSISFTSAPTTVIINSLAGTTNFNGIFDLDPGSAIQTLIINAAAPFKSQFGVSQDNFATQTMRTIIVTGSAANYDGDAPAVYLGYPNAPNIDASAMTVGGIFAYISNDQNGNLLIGGPGRDVIGGGAGIDTIRGGAGNDDIEGGGGADILTGGNGNDVFTHDARAGTNTSGLTTGDLITDFTVGADKLTFSEVLEIASTQQMAVQAAVAALAPGSAAAQIATAMAIANTTSNAVSFAAFSGDTYVYYERTGAVSGVALDDIFIKLAGVSSGFTFAGSIAP